MPKTDILLHRPTLYVFVAKVKRQRLRVERFYATRAFVTKIKTLCSEMRMIIILALLKEDSALVENYSFISHPCSRRCHLRREKITFIWERN